MNRQALDAVEQNLPYVLQRKADVAWPEDLIVVAESELEDRPEGEAIEEILFDESLDDSPSLPDSPTRIVRVDSIIEDIIRSPSPSPEANALRELGDINSALRDRFGDDFPGAPGIAGGGTTSHGSNAGSASPLLSPDIYAFYLPWHYFSQSLWGIYLIVEGVQSLGNEIHRVSLGYLNPREARRVAKVFLFHHEAYHNAAETFASRLEVSHRVPCYVAGFQPVWRSGFKGGALHEEGLATAYAADKVRTNAFEDIYPPGALRTGKRRIAHAALVNIIGRMPSAYRSALLLIDPQQYKDGQNLFLEENRNNCFPPVPPPAGLPPEVWDASPHAMRPSLQRNKSFSYVVRRSNPLIRRALQVPHFKRTDFISQLNARLGGQEIAQGRGEHPKWRSNGGKTVPIPGHRELGRGLCRKILHQLGINIGLTEFMSQSGALTSEFPRAQ